MANWSCAAPLSHWISRILVQLSVLGKAFAPFANRHAKEPPKGDSLDSFVREDLESAASHASRMKAAGAKR